ncbi:uncharacterized protein LOC133790833 [Humulus lupulus]|uniref:uncharacterized protein LOC133790833 n=1 Tax=Humulus lupulus TaxID=3486 RepID=UPI002B408C9F|nr:uncharacterized protein LOC133790833 [Humulus lupulus]XP_062084613.1 uncharacterized protein LOC133790833 [Humulus lupulus]XP_062084614.1 uncharacterized protein LOC133790833 [Humulus lupulus]
MSPMECNKEEAVRAMGLAEKKMHSGDFPGAYKIAQKAQRLFPDLENISQLLAVCEVHCSALVKVGTEKDWYKILQIEQTVDGATIKKQYRKLALLLHPDKNKFAGAEAAFKLIGEANMVLSDQAKRSSYDMKYRVVKRTAPPKPSIHHSNAGASVQQQYGASVNLQNFPRAQYAAQYPYQQTQPVTFWTCCPFCNVRYQFYKDFVNKLLLCTNCLKNYVAHDMGVQGAPSGSVRAAFPNQGPPVVPSQCNNVNFSGKRSPNPFPCPPQMPKAGPPAKPSGQSKMEEKDIKDAPVTKQQVKMPKSKKSGSSGHTNRKRGRRFVEESSESRDTEAETEDVYKDNVFDSSKLNERQHHRRSSRQKQNISYKDNFSDDDDFVSPPKRPRVATSSSSSEDDNRKTFVNGGITKGDGSHKEESKQFEGVPDKDRFSSKRSDAVAMEEGLEASDSEHFPCPDPEFNDFDKDKKKHCFAVNQVWACYDPVDGMPRFYARIKKVISEFKITWLESAPEDEIGDNWVNSELPVACGKYTLGDTQPVNLTIFSHQMHCMKGGRRGTLFVYPRKGETWALFQNWDINWSSDPKIHFPFHYEYVEILSDYQEDTGVSVAYLGRVKGFVSLFQQIQLHGTVKLQIPPNELYRFSHRIPSFKMTGEEREGVPKGSYEFDPAALPPSFFNVCDEDVKTNNDVHAKNAADQIPASGIPENNSKRETLISRKSPRKSNGNGKTSGGQSTAVDTGRNDMNQGNVAASNGNATVPQADEKMKTPKKQGISHDIDFKLRRSPRDLSKKNEAVSNQHSNSEKIESSASSSGVKFNNTSNSCNGDRVKDHCSQECYDFTQQRSKGKFKCDQIWALRTDGYVFPKTYAQVKKIETTPEFRVHVALLELCSTLKGAIQPVSCGTFKVKSEGTRVFLLSSFSHCLNVKAIMKKYEIYPRKGEIWAMYKNQHNELTPKLDGEYDIVEVMEEHGQNIQVAILIRVVGFKSMFKAPRIQRSKTGLLEILRDEMGKFSHQIPALQHTGEKDSRLAGCWELDPLSIPASLLSLD